MGWAEFATIFAAFYLLHSVPVRAPVRPWLVARLGHAGFGLAYSALSLGMLAWLFVAVERAPFVPLWPEPPGTGWIVLAGMVAAGLILAFGLFRPNPLSFGGSRNGRFDPERAGILRYIRHPALAAFFLWAGAHLVVNGDLAHVVMFGSFAAFAIFGMRLVDRRRQREMGLEAWRRMVAAMKPAPFVSPVGAALRVAGVAGAVLLLVMLHPWFAGVGIAWRFLPGG